MTPLRTRIAPSPTGYAHVGTMRTALFNWLAARATGGQFILRIDDTDAERNDEAAVAPILEGLRWLGLVWDEFYRQSERMHLYKAAAVRMLDAGIATKDDGAIRLKVQPDMPRSWSDMVAGDVAITDRDLEVIDGLVLVRSEDKGGQALYQLASIYDDYAMGVNCIIRGTDHIPNTAKQVAIWHALNKVTVDGPARDLPRFGHVGLIFKDKKKMSKRTGAPSLLDFRDKGFHPDALFNSLLRMGWGPKEDTKENSLLTRERALDLFLAAGNMKSSQANFDEAKLLSYDRKIKGAAERAARSAAATP